MTKQKIFLISGIVLVISLIIGGIFLGLYLKDLNDYQNKVNNMQISDIDISKLQDAFIPAVMM